MVCRIGVGPHGAVQLRRRWASRSQYDSDSRVAKAARSEEARAGDSGAARPHARRFSQWLLTIPHAPDLPHLVNDVPQLNIALESYGRALFRFGRPRGDYVNVVLAIVDLRRELRRQLGPAWECSELWQSHVPGGNRLALPLIVLKAFTTLSLSWGWLRTAAMLRLCFHAMLRPSEALKAKRGHLVLPEDLWRDPSADRVYINIESPKTRTSAARQQYGRSDDPFTAFLWRTLCGSAGQGTLLWDGAPARFRARWNVL